jgi:hypothetical protein
MVTSVPPLKYPLFGFIPVTDKFGNSGSVGSGSGGSRRSHPTYRKIQINIKNIHKII